MKVPAISAWNEDLQAALHQRMPGRADLDNADPEEADAMGVELKRPELPGSEMASSLEGAIIHNLRDEVLRYLARRAYRLEYLWKPVVDLFPDRKFSRID